MRYVEERDFTVRFDLRCEFPEEYEGERDGYAWLREFHERIAPRLLQAVVTVIRDHPGWTVRPTNRGRSSEDEISLLVERVP
ncbi:MAG: hypothetical protein HYV62_08715 [Candidatus Rokubacteria bacterium]|nr:hypothetical protein [Candidatus Rokubacteria bacterium]